MTGKGKKNNYERLLTDLFVSDFVSKCAETYVKIIYNLINQTAFGFIRFSFTVYKVVKD